MTRSRERGTHLKSPTVPGQLMASSGPRHSVVRRSAAAGRKPEVGGLEAPPLGSNRYSGTRPSSAAARHRAPALRGGIGFPSDVRNNYGRKILTTIDELDDAAVLELSR